MADEFFEILPEDITPEMKIYAKELQDTVAKNSAELQNQKRKFLDYIREKLGRNPHLTEDEVNKERVQGLDIFEAEEKKQQRDANEALKKYVEGVRKQIGNKKTEKKPKIPKEKLPKPEKLKKVAKPKPAPKEKKSPTTPPSVPPSTTSSTTSSITIPPKKKGRPPGSKGKKSTSSIPPTTPLPTVIPPIPSAIPTSTTPPPKRGTGRPKGSKSKIPPSPTTPPPSSIPASTIPPSTFADALKDLKEIKKQGAEIFDDSKKQIKAVGTLGDSVLKKQISGIKKVGKLSTNQHESTLGKLQEVQTKQAEVFTENTEQLKKVSKLQNASNKKIITDKDKILTLAKDEYKTKLDQLGVVQKEAKVFTDVAVKKLDVLKKEQGIKHDDLTFQAKLPTDSAEYAKREAIKTKDKADKQQIQATEKSGLSQMKLQEKDLEKNQRLAQNQDILNQDLPKKLKDIQKKRSNTLADQRKLLDSTRPDRTLESKRKGGLLTDQSIINKQNSDAQTLQDRKDFALADRPQKLLDVKDKRKDKRQQANAKFKSDLSDDKKIKRSNRVKLNKNNKIDTEQYGIRQGDITLADSIDLDTRNKTKKDLGAEEVRDDFLTRQDRRIDKQTTQAKKQKQLDDLVAKNLVKQADNLRTTKKLNKDQRQISTDNKQTNKDTNVDNLKTQKNVNKKRRLDASDLRKTKKQVNADSLVNSNSNKNRIAQVNQDKTLISSDRLFESLDKLQRSQYTTDTQKIVDDTKRRKAALDNRYNVATAAIRKNAELAKQQAKYHKSLFDFASTTQKAKDLKEKQDFDAEPDNVAAKAIKQQQTRDKNKAIVDAQVKKSVYAAKLAQYKQYQKKHPIGAFVSRNIFGGGPPVPPGGPPGTGGGGGKNNLSNTTSELKKHQTITGNINANFAKGNFFINNLGSSLSRSLASLYLIRRAFVAIQTAFKGVIDLGTQFDANLKGIQTLSPNIKDSDLGAISKDILNISRSFGQDPVNTSTAFFEAVSSGALKTEGALSDNLKGVAKFQEVVAKAAVGGRTDFLTAQKAILATINAYDLSLEDATRVSDAFFNTVNYGVVSFPDLVSSIGGVVSIAHQAGISIEDLSAAMAVATKRGITATEAVTGIRSAIANIIRPGAQAQAAAKKFGIDLSAAALKARGFIGVLKDIKSKNLDPGQISTLLPNIRAFLRTSSLIGEGFDEYEKLFNQFITESGAADRAFEIMSESIQHEFNLLKSETKSLGIEIFQLSQKDLLSLITTFKQVVIEVGNFAKENDLLAKTFKLVEDAIKSAQNAAKKSSNVAGAAKETGEGFFGGIYNTINDITGIGDATSELFSVKTLDESFDTFLASIYTAYSQYKQTVDKTFGDNTATSISFFDAKEAFKSRDVVSDFAETASKYIDIARKLKEEQGRIAEKKKLSSEVIFDEEGEFNLKQLREEIQQRQILLQQLDLQLKQEDRLRTKTGESGFNAKTQRDVIDLSTERTFELSSKKKNAKQEIKDLQKLLDLEEERQNKKIIYRFNQQEIEREFKIIEDLKKKELLQYSAVEDEKLRLQRASEAQIAASLDGIARYAKIKYKEDAKNFTDALKIKVNAQKQAEEKLASLAEDQRMQFESFEERSWEIITSGLEKPGELIQRFGIADTYETRANAAKEAGNPEETLRLAQKAQSAFEQIALRTDITPEEKETAFDSFKRTQLLIEGSYTSQKNKQQEIIESSKKGISELSAKLTQLQADALIKLQFQIDNNALEADLDRMKAVIKGINEDMQALGLKPSKNPDSVVKSKDVSSEKGILDLDKPRSPYIPQEMAFEDLPGLNSGKKTASRESIYDSIVNPETMPSLSGSRLPTREETYDSIVNNPFEAINPTTDPIKLGGDVSAPPLPPSFKSKSRNGFSSLFGRQEVVNNPEDPSAIKPINPLLDVKNRLSVPGVKNNLDKASTGTEATAQTVTNNITNNITVPLQEIPKDKASIRIFADLLKADQKTSVTTDTTGTVGGNNSVLKT